MEGAIALTRIRSAAYVTARERVNGNLAQWRLGIPLGRMAEAADQAAAITFLLGETGRHITGQVITVDGGQSFL